MKKTMILLIGEQPLPNLLPLKHFHPDHAVLVRTSRTKKVSEHLQTLTPTDIQLSMLDVAPYSIVDITHQLRQFLSTEALSSETLYFNVTGGTKPMALAAAFIARDYGAPLFYFQTEGQKSLLYHYEFTNDGTLKLEESLEIPETITLDEYIRAFVGHYQVKDFPENVGGQFERLVYETLKPEVDEIMSNLVLGGALEIDLAVRCGNQVAIAEVKTGKKARSKSGIDQLNTAGGREYLGIYTRKVLIVNAKWNDQQSNLRELAEARRIQVIELPSYDGVNHPFLSPEDKDTLIQTVSNLLHCRKG